MHHDLQVELLIQNHNVNFSIIILAYEKLYSRSKQMYMIEYMF